MQSYKSQKLRMISIAANKLSCTIDIGFKQQSIPLPPSSKEQYLVIYNNHNLYYIQCPTNPIPDRQQVLYTLAPSSSSWSTHPLILPKGSKQNPYYPRSSCAWVVHGNLLYCFGGRDFANGGGKPDNRLCVLNLDKKSWRFDIDTPYGTTLVILPESRIYGSLVGYRRYLLLTGGTYQNNELTNSNLWIYDLNKNTWIRYINFMPILINISMCVFNDSLYIFGMKHTNYDSISQLYQIPIQTSQTSDPLPLSLKPAINLSLPQKQPTNFNIYSYYKLLYHKKNLIFLLETGAGSAKSLQTRSMGNKIWLFDALTHNWQKAQLQIERGLIDVLYDGGDGFYFVEGLPRIERLSRIVIQDEEIKRVINQTRFKQWRKCQICYQSSINNNTQMQSTFKISKVLLDSLTQKIEFPFAALGIFAENSLQLNAEYINFHYLMYKDQPILKISDDNHFNYSNEELQQVVVNFEAEINFNFGSVQRRVRSILSKEFMRKEIGANMKIAAMRLGSEMLYISLTPNYEARVAYFVQQGDQYVCYFYVFDQKTNKVFEQYSNQVKIYIQSKFKDLISQALHQNPGAVKYAPYKNTTYILGLRTVINEQGKVVPQIQYQSTPQCKDIIYISPNPTIYQTFLQHGCKINEAIDVSLNTYLSLLFLKNQHLKISIQINYGEKKYVKREDPIADKNALLKFVTSIDSMIKNFDLKFVQLFYNNKLSKKTGIFHNGVLIYHKNRLIKRFGCQLGGLLNALEFTDKVSFGYFNVLGKIQVPDSVEVNQQKTNFVHEVMLQKFYSKLKAIHETLQKIHTQKQNPKLNVQRQGPKLRSKGSQQFQFRHPPTKKVKKSVEDQSYNAN